MSRTRTYVLLEVSESAYKEIKSRLERTVHGIEFGKDAEYGERVNMDGIAIVNRDAKRQTVYGWGYYKGEETYAMCGGPTPDLDKLLEDEPEDGIEGAVVFQFNPDGADKIIRRWTGKRWKKV